MSKPLKEEPLTSPEKEDEEPRVIRLSTDEYFFPSSSSRRTSTATSGTGVSNTATGGGSGPSSPGSSTGEPPIIPFAAISARYRAETDGIYRDEDDEETERLVSFKDQTITRPIPRRPQPREESSDDEYEETLLYIDLDDIPNVDELFAVEPDDFLSFQTKRQRELPKPKKPTHPEIKVKIHNLDSAQPVVQIGSRYYVGKYEEPMGSSLFFQPKEPIGKPLPPNRLESIVPEQEPKRDRVFHEKLCSDKYSEYELVANVHKVLKCTRREGRVAGSDLQQLPVTPGGLPPLMPQKTWPGGYTPSQVFSGRYHSEKQLPHGPFDSSFNTESGRNIASVPSTSGTSRGATSTVAGGQGHESSVSPERNIMEAIGARSSPGKQDSILGLDSY